MSLNQRISPSLSENLRKQQVPLSQAQGFTLIELMIVLAIFGVMVAIAVPSFQEWRQHSAVNNATTALFTTLKRARSLAVAENRSVQVSLTTADPYSFTYDSGGCGGCSARAVELAQFSPNLTLNGNFDTVTFFSSGTASTMPPPRKTGGTVKIKSGVFFKCITFNIIGRAYIVQLGASAAQKAVCANL